MSNAVYPTLPGLSWPIKRTPLWKTNVKATPSGREFRSAMMTSPRHRFALQYEFLRNAATWQEFQALFGFFNARQGAYDSFLFMAPDDSAVSAHLFGVGDGVTSAFQIVRTLGGNAEPVFDLVGTPAIVTSAYGGTVYQNLLVYSLAFSNAAWTKNTCTVTSGATTAPDGVSPADLLTASGSDSYVTQSAAYQPLIPFTFSVWLKASSAVTITLTTRQLPSSTYVSNTTVNVTTSWQRFSVSGVTVAGTTSINVFVGGLSGFTSGEAVYAWGAQLEAQAAPASGTFGTAGVAYYFSVGATGLVTFSVAPPTAAQLTWTGSYYWRCRFEADDLSFEKFMSQFWKTGEVRLLTVKP